MHACCLCSCVTRKKENKKKLVGQQKQQTQRQTERYSTVKERKSKKAAMDANQVRTERKRLIASALSNHFHLPLLPGSISEEIENGDTHLKSLCLHILKSAGKSSPNDEVTKWIGFAESFPVHSQECSHVLMGLDEELALKSVLLGNGLAPSEADVIVFAAIHSFVISLPDLEKGKLPHVMRWIDYIQSKEDLGKLFEKIFVEKAQFKPQLQRTKLVANLQADSSAKVTSRNTKKAEQSEAELNAKKSDNVKTSMGNKESTSEKKGSPEIVAVEKDKELNVSVLNLRVGLICKAWKHPSADSLLVEEIDVGDAKLRQVVSGLAKYCSPDELMNRRVVLITNVKPGKLRDVMSEGLVLCASNEDHTVVEPLISPESAKIGERISFSGIDGKPEDILNPKKKQFEKIAPNLFTDDKGVATFKGIPFMTSGGPCTSSLPKASIK